MPHYHLAEIKKVVGLHNFDFEYNASKCFDELSEEVGFKLGDLVECIQLLKPSDFHKSIEYRKRIADVYKTIYPFKTRNEWEEIEVDNIPLYIKFVMNSNPGSEKVVLFLSFKQE